MATSLAVSRTALRPHTLAPRAHNTPRTISSIVPRVAMTEPLGASPRPAKNDAAAANQPPAPLARWQRSAAPQDAGEFEFHHSPILSPHNAQLVCGRLAMLGFVAGVFGEVTHGAPLLSQFAAAEPAALTVAFVLSLASAAPLLAGEEEGDEVAGPFQPEAEIVNGNLAIAGVAAMVLMEALKGTALL